MSDIEVVGQPNDHIDAILLPNGNVCHVHEDVTAHIGELSKVCAEMLVTIAEKSERIGAMEAEISILRSTKSHVSDVINGKSARIRVIEAEVAALRNTSKLAYGEWLRASFPEPQQRPKGYEIWLAREGAVEELRADNANLEARIEALEAELAKERAAVDWYADTKHWKRTHKGYDIPDYRVVMREDGDKVHHDASGEFCPHIMGGKRARQRQQERSGGNVAEDGREE